MLFLSFFFRRAKDHEKYAQFAANVYETLKGLTLLSSLYVISTEAYTDICLKAVQNDVSFTNEDREKRESGDLLEKRYACVYSDQGMINTRLSCSLLCQVDNSDVPPLREGGLQEA